MQRDRARERMERAKRQWELEHASDTCIDGNNLDFDVFQMIFFYVLYHLHFDNRIYKFRKLPF